VLNEDSSEHNEEETTTESAPKNKEKEIIFVAVATKADTVDLLNELQNKLPSCYYLYYALKVLYKILEK